MPPVFGPFICLWGCLACGQVLETECAKKGFEQESSETAKLRKIERHNMKQRPPPLASRFSGAFCSKTCDFALCDFKRSDFFCDCDFFGTLRAPQMNKDLPKVFHFLQCFFSTFSVRLPRLKHHAKVSY